MLSNPALRSALFPPYFAHYNFTLTKADRVKASQSLPVNDIIKVKVVFSRKINGKF